jgi:phage-related protein
MSQPIDEAYVEVRPDLDNFATTLGRRLTSVLNNIQASVDRSMRQTSDRIGAAGQDAGQRFGDGFTRDAGRSLNRLTGIVSSAVGGLAGLGKASAGLAGITAAVGTGATALAGLASAAAAAIPAIIGVAAALATTAGALVAVPGAVAVVAAAIGTLKLGTQGLGDAFKAVAEEDSAAFNEALKGLAPNAQAFARQVNTLKPAFDSLQLRVQNALFAGTDRVLAALARTTLPTLRAGMTGLAATINGQVVAALTGLNTRANQLNLATVFTAARNIVASFGPALQPVTQALLDVVRVGAEVTETLTGGLGAEIATFAERVSAMAASGDLAQMFRDGLDAAGQFLRLGQDILGIVGGIANAAGSGGGGLFAFFDRLNEAINSVAGQAALTELFANLGTIGQALTPVLLAVGQALGPVSAAVGALAVAFAPTLITLVQALGGALTSLLPGFVALTPLAGVLAAGLQPLADILVGLVVGAAPGLVAFLNGLVGALQALAPAALPVGQALGAVATALAPLLPLIGAQLANGLTIVATLLGGVASELGPLITLFGNLATESAAKLLPVFTQLAAQVLPLMAQAGVDIAAALAPLAPVVSQIASVFADQLAAALPGLVSTLSQLLPIVVQVAQQFGQTLLSALTQIMPHLPTLVSLGFQLAEAFLRILAAVYPVLPQLTEMALLITQLALNSGLLQGFIGTVTTVLGAAAAQIRVLTAVITTLLSPMDLLRTAAGLVGTAIGALGTALATVGSVVGGAVTTALTAVRAALNAVFYTIGFTIGAIVGLFTQLPLRIWAAINVLSNLVGAVFASVRNIAVGNTMSTVSGVAGFFGQLPGRVWGAIVGVIGRVASVLGALRGAAASAAAGVVASVVSPFRQLSGRVGAAVSALSGRVLGVLRSLAGQAGSAGANIIRSIVGGVNGLVGWAVGQARSAINRIVQGIRDALPGSPVKEGPLTVLNNGYAGRQIVRMLTGGITSEAPEMRAALDNALAGVTPAITPTVGQPTPGTLPQPVTTTSGDSGLDGALLYADIYIGDELLDSKVVRIVRRENVAQARKLAARPRTI